MFVIFLIFGLLLTNLNAMEKKNEIKSIIAGSGKENSQIFDVKEARTFILDGKACNKGANGNKPIRLEITQITDKDVQQNEYLSISADDNIFPHIIFNHCEDIISVSLYAPDQIIQPSQDIRLSLALKNYAKVTTEGNIKTSFTSNLASEELKIKATSGARMRLSSIKAPNLKIKALDDSCIKKQPKTQLITNSISIICKDNAHITADIQAKLLQVEKYGPGKMTLAGNVHEQRLYHENGSYLTYNLVAQIVRPIIRAYEGTIQLTGLQLIYGSLSFESKDVPFYKTYPWALYMLVEKKILKNNAFLEDISLKGSSEEEILKYFVWEYLSKKHPNS
jgi:hypothetical protein